jgi:hypothetical protein
LTPRYAAGLALWTCQPAATDPLSRDHLKVGLAGDRVVSAASGRKKINEKFAGEMNFECESECDNDETGYWRSWGWTVHICPAWFKLTSPDARTEDILFIAIAEELGMDYGPKIGTPAHASLSDKQAYDSASAYVGYARDVTKKLFP